MVPSGFSLLELMAAVAVAGIMASIVFASMVDLTAHQRFDRGLNRIADVYAAARATAVSTHRTIRIRYGVETDCIWVTSGTAAGSATAFAMPAGVDLLGVTPAESQGDVVLRIGPSGMGRTHTLLLRGEGRLRGTIRINGFTGQAETAVTVSETGHEEP